MFTYNALDDNSKVKRVAVTAKKKEKVRKQNVGEKVRRKLSIRKSMIHRFKQVYDNRAPLSI